MIAPKKDTTNRHNSANAPQKRVLAELIGNPLDERSISEKCDEVGVSRWAHYRWLEDDPTYGDMIQKATTRYITTLRAKAYQCLDKAMRDGNVHAAMTVLKACGDVGGNTNIHIQNTNTTHEKPLPERIAEWRQSRLLPTDGALGKG